MSKAKKMLKVKAASDEVRLVGLQFFNQTHMGPLDIEEMHKRAEMMTTDGAAAVVHNHAWDVYECNSDCVRYPGKVPVIEDRNRKSRTRTSRESRS